MADIGSTLRETRMRDRIDITTVESATKIRAKYLRALENEEWDLLPGPTFVRTFLRTYGDYLGLDSKMLVEEYKQLFEQPGPQEMVPFSSRGGGPSGRRQRPPRSVPPWLVVGGVVVLLLGVLFALGTFGQDGDDPEVSRHAHGYRIAVRAGRQEVRERRRERRRRREAAAQPKTVSLAIVPEGEVNVCLVGAGGEPLINFQNLTEPTERYRGKRLRVTFGNGLVSMRVNGKDFPVEDTDGAIGFELTPGNDPEQLPDDELPHLRVSARAGVIVTGTEVLSGIITDKNGPWLSERLRENGVDCAQILIVGDRPEDMRAALESQKALGLDLIVTSGGLGPTADDLTATVVGEFAGREMVLDEALEGRIWTIIERLTRRWTNIDHDAMRAANRKQAVIPDGATILEPVGTAPGLIVPPADSGPTVLVLPGPPRELQPMWQTALGTGTLRTALSGATELDRGMLRLFGIPESVIARTLEVLAGDGIPLDRLEITTCLRRGEIEIATVYPPAETEVYHQFVEGVRSQYGELLFSEDGTTIDEQVATLLDGHTVATAESCTGGLLAARLTERPGSSAYVLGGVVVYSNEAKVRQAGVPAELIERHGAVSPEVAAALADGAREALGAEIGVGITGIAGPDGGTEAKPVGTVCLSVAAASGNRQDRSVVLPGNRADVRDRSSTLALHLLRRLLLAGA